MSGIWYEAMKAVLIVLFLFCGVIGISIFVSKEKDDDEK